MLWYPTSADSLHVLHHDLSIYRSKQHGGRCPCHGWRGQEERHTSISSSKCSIHIEDLQISLEALPDKRFYQNNIIVPNAGSNDRFKLKFK